MEKVLIFFGILLSIILAVLIGNLLFERLSKYLDERKLRKQNIGIGTSTASFYFNQPNRNARVFSEHNFLSGLPGTTTGATSITGTINMSSESRQQLMEIASTGMTAKEFSDALSNPMAKKEEVKDINNKVDKQNKFKFISGKQQ